MTAPMFRSADEQRRIVAAARERGLILPPAPKLKRPRNDDAHRAKTSMMMARLRAERNGLDVSAYPARVRARYRSRK